MLRSPIARLPLVALALLAAHCASSSVEAPPAGAATDPSFDPATFVSAGVVASPAEQERMRQWTLSQVDRRYVRGSFEDAGRTFDCVDFDKQPSCAEGGCPSTPPTPPTPPAPPAPPASAGPGAPAMSVLPQGGACAPGTVPVLRPNLDMMIRYPTLEAYQAKMAWFARTKGPGPGRMAPPSP